MVTDLLSPMVTELRAGGALLCGDALYRMGAHENAEVHKFRSHYKFDDDDIQSDDQVVPFTNFSYYPSYFSCRSDLPVSGPFILHHFECQPYARYETEATAQGALKFSNLELQRRPNEEMSGLWDVRRMVFGASHMEDGTVRHAPNAFPITEQDADVEVKLKMKVVLNPPSPSTGARISLLRINMYGSTDPADRLWIPDSLLGTTQHTAKRAKNVGNNDDLQVFNSNLSNTVIKLNKNTKYFTRCSSGVEAYATLFGFHTLVDDDDPRSILYMPTCYPRSSGIRCDGYLSHYNESVPHEHSDYRTDPECFTHPVCSKVNSTCHDGGIEAPRATFTLYNNTGIDWSTPFLLGMERGYPSSMSKPYCGLLGPVPWFPADSSVVNPNFNTRYDLDLSDGYMDVVFHFDMANKRMIVKDGKTQVQLCDQPLHSTYRDAVFDMTKIDAIGIETNLDTVEIATFHVSKTVGSSPPVTSHSGSPPPSSPPPPFAPKNKN